MSFFLDPIGLVFLGALLYIVRKRFEWDNKTVNIISAIIIGAFILDGIALYLDLIRWYIPGIVNQLGSVWMFHTNITGIKKSDVPLSIVILMFLIYPIWLYLGYVIIQYLTRPKIINKTYSYEDVRSRKPIQETITSVFRDPDTRKCVRECISNLGGIQKFVKRGDNVLIKANISGGNPEIEGSFTSIDVVDEVVKIIKKACGHPCVVDADMVWTEFWPVANLQGWKIWSRSTNTCLINLSDTDLAYFDFGKGSVLGKTLISKNMIDADVIISIPTMKTHLLTAVTLGMKNMYGTFPEIDKVKFHKAGIEEVIFEINKAFKPNLTIIDGSIGGESFGPLSSVPVNFQTIIASNNVVAADSIACELMGYDPLDILHIRKAYENGLGNIVDFNFKNLPYSNLKDGNWDRPDPRATKFYEEVIEEVLHLPIPYLENFFDLASDFILYDFATLPIFKDLTPIAEKILYDVIFFRLFESSSEEFKEKFINKLVDK
jgi:uncharacterized protein (DUF362 family)